jgi:hypothetical protein
MYKHEVITLTIKSHGFKSYVVKKIFEDNRAIYGIQRDEVIFNSRESNTNAAYSEVDIVISKYHCNTKDDFTSLETAIQNEIDRLLRLKDDLELIQNDKS